MTNKMKVYLAGPINDCSDSECRDWRERMKQEFPNVEFLDPMRRDYRNLESVETATEIVENDKRDILDTDLVFVYHDKPSVGTSMEILFAFDRGIYVLTVGCTGKPLSPWILYHSTEIVDTIEKGIEKLKEIEQEFYEYEVGATWEDEV